MLKKKQPYLFNILKIDWLRHTRRPLEKQMPFIEIVDAQKETAIFPFNIFKLKVLLTSKYIFIIYQTMEFIHDA